MKIIPQKYMPDDTSEVITAQLVGTVFSFAGFPDFVTAQLTGGVLSFAGFPDQESVLTDLQSSETKRLRFTINNVGVISVNAAEDYWLIAEIDLSAKEYESEAVVDADGHPVLNENGEPEMATTIKPITVGNLILTVWQLPKGE